MKRVSFLKKAQKGFTLIELIITIVIIGILAAVAIPKFVSLTGDANQAVAEGIAGALASASSVNYAKSQSPTGGATAISTCAGLVGLLTEALPSADWAVDGAANLTTDGVPGTCTVTGPGGASKSFSAFGAA